MDKTEFRRLMAGYLTDIADKEKILREAGLIPEYINSNAIKLIKHLAYELIDE
jgi:hypothetical protein